MKAIIGWAKKNPTRAAAIAVIVLGWFSFLVPAAVIGGIGSIIGILLGGPIYGAVTPVTTAVENTAKAVTEAVETTAVETVKSLGETTVGAVGEVTDLGQAVAETVSRDVLGVLLPDL